ncbi:MAG: SGNH/GDSL hydrolase family protein, partial [bacterium]
KREMRGVAKVNHIGENARYTEHGLNNFESWLKDDKSDVILFNCGLWDLVYRLPTTEGYGKKDKIHGVQYTSIDAYENNLEKLVEKLKKTEAKLFFVTTSYIPDNEPGMYAEDAIKYNEVAKSVMKRHDVEVIDIYDKSRQVHKLYGKGKDNVHYSKRGYHELGKHISFFLKEVL